MTFQPPPPPPGDQPPPPQPGNQPLPPQPGNQPPPPQSQGQWNPPPGAAGGPGAPGPGPGAPGPGGSGGTGAFDPKSVNPLDWGIVGVGVIAFFSSFFDWYTISFSGYGSGGESAWNGFFGWFAVLLAIAGSAVVAVSLFAPQTKMPIPARLLGLGLYAVALISVILALFIFPESVPDSPGLDTGRGFGFWLGLIAIIAGLVLSLMRAQQTNTAMPGPLNKMPKIGK